MQTSRNAPCPCGSGRKYKRCCLPTDRAKAVESARTVGEAMQEAAASCDWEVGVFPLSVEIHAAPARRTTVAMVTADGLVLHVETSHAPLGTVEDVADALAGAVRETRDAVGVTPGVVRVRHAEVAAALADALVTALGDGIEVRADGDLSGLLDAARSLNREMAGHDEVPLAESAPSWREGWGLPGSVCGALFDAAAAFYRAEPWARLGDGPLLAVVGDREWAAAVMGEAGLQRGLALLSDYEDYDLIGWMGPEWVLESFEGAMITLDFGPLDQLPGPARREIMASGWTVAGPDAYPNLYTLNTPGGGIDSAVVEDLTAILRAVPAFLAGRDEPGGPGDLDDIEVWEAEDGGVRLEYLPGPGLGYGPAYTVEDGDFDADVADRLEELRDRLLDVAGESPEVAPPVLELALELLTVYAGERPDALLRAHGPHTFAAGALHAALLWDSFWTRAPSAATVAGWFDVSSASVSARSRELRTVAEESADLWDDADDGLEIRWTDALELRDLLPVRDAAELREHLGPVVAEVRLQEHMGEGFDIDAFVADHGLHDHAPAIQAVLTAGVRDFLDRSGPGRADAPDRRANADILDDPVAFGYVVRAGLRDAALPAPVLEVLARYGLGLLLRVLPPDFDEPPYAAVLPIAWLADHGALEGDALAAAAWLLAREPLALEGVGTDEIAAILDAITEDETLPYPQRMDAVLDLAVALDAAEIPVEVGRGHPTRGLESAGSADPGITPRQRRGTGDDSVQIELL